MKMQSSSQTFIFRYFFPVFMIGMSLLGLYIMFYQEGSEMKGFAKAFAVMLIWISYFLIQMPIRLKNIDAKDNGIIIDKKHLIEYKDIVWLTKFDITSPYFVTIKYRDKESRTDKKIAYMPSQRNQTMFEDDTLTAYIKNMVKEIKPNFTREQEPSSKRNFIFIMLLSIPFTLLAFYFMNETAHFFN
ncbi:MAG: hypothetical protein GQ564_13805 [Bacteroidales bacterium]|nr:hypothetical protein [Bacteroidales bacterium]